VVLKTDIVWKMTGQTVCVAGKKIMLPFWLNIWHTALQ